MDFYGDVSWVNSEVQNHYVELTLTPGEADGLGNIPASFSLPKGANKIDRLALSQFLASQATTSKTVTIAVTLKSVTESSTPTTAAQTLALDNTATFTNLSYNPVNGVLTLPSWSGVVEVAAAGSRVILSVENLPRHETVWSFGSLTFLGLGVSSIDNRGAREDVTAFPRERLILLPSLLATEVVGIGGGGGSTATATTAGSLGADVLASRAPQVQGSSGAVDRFEGLTDGGFYSVSAVLRSAKVPERAGGVWTNSFTTTTQNVAFEYYRRGTPPVEAPAITSLLAAASSTAIPFTYHIIGSNNPTSYAASGLPAGLSVNTTTGRITGTIASAGVTNVTISATNSGGTGSATLVITAAAPVPVFISQGFADTFIDTPFFFTVATDDSRAAIAVNFGSASGLSYNAATRAISGSVATVGSYNIGLTATNSFGTATATLSLNVRPFTAFGGSVSVVRNSRVRQALSASHRATWSINSGAPSGFSIEYVPVTFGTATGPDAAYIVGTPLAAGSFGLQLTATRAGTSQTSAATFTLAVTDAPLPATTINGNADVIRSGVSVERGSNVSLSFTSLPSPATWDTTGLPPGMQFDGNGLITGAPTVNGVYAVSLSAQAEGYSRGTLGLRITVVEPPKPPPPPPPPTGLTPETRSPWILQQWPLTDLSIYARTRIVQSTMFEQGGALTIKLGDAITFAIMFIDQGNAVFAMEPTRLRLTIRKADNLDDLIVFKSATPPTAATTDGQTYYLLPVTTGNREREVAIEWAEDNGKNEPLPCVADVDWVKNGKTYSSRSFPVLLDLDVTRP